MRVAIVLTLVAVLAACGSNKKENAEPTVTPVSATPSNAVSTEPSETTESSPSSEPSPSAKELSDEENMALDYINVYINGSDLDAKKSFVEEKVHADVKSVFQLAANSETPEKNKLLKPEVNGSVDYESEGKKGKLVLIQGEKSGAASEFIVLIMEGKVGWAFSPDEKNEDLKEQFNKMRKLFD